MVHGKADKTGLLIHQIQELCDRQSGRRAVQRLRLGGRGRGMGFEVDWGVGPGDRG